MSKDCRIVVRMSEELRDWVHAQAQLGEQDDAAFVRMVLSNLRRGGASPALAGMPEQARPVASVVIERDVLDVSSTAEALESGVIAGQQHQQAEAPLVDVDDIVAASLAEAEAAGLTQRQIEEVQGDMPEAGVRSLMRRPIPFSHGTQSRHLEQFFN